MQSLPETRHAGSTPITQLLVRWSKGDQAALDEVTAAVYDEMRRLAGRRLRSEKPGNTLQPTALVHEAYLQLLGSGNVAWEGRSHFLGIAGRLMGQILIQRARARSAGKRGGPGGRVSLDDAGSVPDSRSSCDAGLQQAVAKLSCEAPRAALVIELRYFGGMTTPEIASELGVSPSTVEREMRLGLAWLHRELRGCGT